ncbi:hypothetical protein BGZ74_003220 [Mortierella antarctica]|nr:hypothetical protein BGZ74_003220 [Mortierella antarctica]
MSTLVKPPCVVCKTPSITRCSRCKINHYCSEKCQRKDWPSHKLACVPAKAPSSTSNANTSTSSASNANSTGSTKKPTTAPKTTTKTPKLPDPSQPLNLRAVDMSGYKKPEPSRTCTDLKFQYQCSADGVDENLVIFFHGLGDKIEPSFTRLAASLQLPMTATCCVQAPLAVPYLEEEGWTWYPSFNNLTGEQSPERLLQVKQKIRPNLVSLVKHFVDKCGFASHKIFLFGFSQGGEMALDLAAFGGVPLGGVISIGGYLMDEVQNDPPALKQMPTQVLVLQGDKDDTRPINVAKDKFKYIKRVFGANNCVHKVVDGMGHGMPTNEAGWQPLMVFFANNLSSASPALAGQADVYEVTR